MTFTEVKELPKRKKVSKTRKPPSKKKDVYEFLTEFMDTNIRFAKIEYVATEYVDPCSAHNSFLRCTKTFKFPIKVKRINHELYLIRTDMGD